MNSLIVRIMIAALIASGFAAILARPDVLTQILVFFGAFVLALVVLSLISKRQTSPVGAGLPESFPETRLIPRPPTFRGKLAAIWDWDMTMNHRLHKIGGKPDWIQSDETPECCGQPTTFYGQLGSLDRKHDLVDNGLIYVFICRKCMNTHAVFQFS